ncbi:MAG: helix-turn-helix transcriptional regulator [Bacillota bacterium]|nr:helix-turn-helix transcriptional regulator [Bacillota bacterium]
MTFRKRLNQLCDWLAVTNADLARRTEVDPSLISRLRNGRRCLREDSPVISALVDGLVSVAREQERLEQLFKYLGIAPASEHGRDTSSPHSRLELWLTEAATDLQPPARRSGNGKARQLPGFADKLDQLIRALNLTNAQIATALHVDPSLVSLYRSGRRIPSEDNWFLQSLLGHLARRIHDTPPQRLTRQRQILRLPRDADVESIKQALECWIQDPDSGSASEAARRFLARLEACEALPQLPPNMEQLIRKLPSPSSRNVQHIGIPGLQAAVRDFLLQCVLLDSPRTLLLHSDHEISWLTNDPEYAQLWRVLMHMTLQQGHHIEIIHRIDRESNEIQGGIEAWLPLYTTGQLRSWTLGGASDSPFRHTRFVLPGVCAVIGTSIAGDDENAVFEYTTVQKQLDYYEHEFACLLQQAKPLLRAEKLDSAAAVEAFLQQLPEPGTEVRHLHSGLPFACLESEDLEFLLAHESLSDMQREVVRQLHALMVRRLAADLAAGQRSDSIELETPAAVKAQEACLSLPFGTVPYPPGLYRTHLARVAELCRCHPDWRLSIRSPEALASMAISLWSDGSVLLTRAGDTPLGLLLNDERLHRGLRSFGSQHAGCHDGGRQEALAAIAELAAGLGPETGDRGGRPGPAPGCS